MTFEEIQGVIEYNLILSTLYLIMAGGSIGSFLHFIAYRVAKGLPVSGNISQCDHCGTWIKKRYNIPLLGYLIIRGKTACCGLKLSPLHFVIELLFGLVTASFLITQDINYMSLSLLMNIYIFTCVSIIGVYLKSFTFPMYAVLLSCLLTLICIVSIGQSYEMGFEVVFAPTCAVTWFAIEYIKEKLQKVIDRKVQISASIAISALSLMIVNFMS